MLVRCVGEVHSHNGTTENGQRDITGDISDKNEKCEDWAKMGECQRNPGFMLENCAVSCDIVSRKGKAYVYDGEDVGVAAFRFAEEYSNHFDSTTNTQQKVLEVAKELQKTIYKYKPHLGQ